MESLFLFQLWSHWQRYLNQGVKIINEDECLVWLTIGAAVCEKDVLVVPIDLELDLGHGGEPPYISHVALFDGVFTATGPSHPELFLPHLDSKHKFQISSSHFNFPNIHVVSPGYSKPKVPNTKKWPFSIRNKFPSNFIVKAKDFTWEMFPSRAGADPRPRPPGPERPPGRGSPERTPEAVLPAGTGWETVTEICPDKQILKLFIEIHFSIGLAGKYCLFQWFQKKYLGFSREKLEPKYYPEKIPDKRNIWWQDLPLDCSLSASGCYQILAETEIPTPSPGCSSQRESSC